MKMNELCHEIISSRSAYDSIQPKYCQLPKGHSGKHSEFHYLDHLRTVQKSVADKIKRDSTMTTGAAWKSAEAGPNRILRWVMLLSDSDLKHYEIQMDKLKPQVVAKLREKSATYDDCMAVAKKLTWLVYQMNEAPKPPQDIREYLENYFGKMVSGSTTCIICKEKLSFSLFSKAQRGKAEIETGHISPREHNAENVGFAHRECNIAQGNKTVLEFYDWIRGIIKRVDNR
ncbi:MAG: hypothetical protein C4557_04680 [Anaerolineaceae bacterium]|jgi:hypothetical protein|nr:MAG: hypothetical protein C4557_04680 [Anaerolineaceae bacterium]